MLRINEEKDYLSRIITYPETKSKEDFDAKLHRFGTLIIIYNIENKTDSG
jgi:hypothetical protein